MIAWDALKNQINLRKHGLDFALAQLVFDDPFHIARQDRIENGEQRWQTIGMAGSTLLLVAHTWSTDRDDAESIRIISARRASKLERKIYEQGS